MKRDKTQRQGEYSEIIGSQSLVIDVDRAWGQASHDKYEQSVWLKKLISSSLVPDPSLPVKDINFNFRVFFFATKEEGSGTRLDILWNLCPGASHFLKRGIVSSLQND